MSGNQTKPKDKESAKVILESGIEVAPLYTQEDILRTSNR